VFERTQGVVRLRNTSGENFPCLRTHTRFWENYGDGEEVVAVDSVVAELVSDEAVAVGRAPAVTVSVVCLLRSRIRESAGSNKLIRMAITAITISNSINVKALTRSRSFGIVDAEQVLFDFIHDRCGARLTKFPQKSSITILPP
jgi:hypothetical protein